MQINKIRHDIDVAVCCITYNHEEFIAQALDSFLNQKTTFDYQIIVGEDHSPDGTAEILKEYANKYPDKIVAIIREENVGAQRNLIDVCEKAGTKYIALCECDDYWIDEYKLQKQYNFMEKHQDIRVCGAHVRIDAPKDWFLRSYYDENENHELIYPECDPDCPKTRRNRTTVFDCNTNVFMYCMLFFKQLRPIGSII